MVVSSITYASREEVKDAGFTAIQDQSVDRVLEAATRMIERTLGRKFYPTVATRYFNWPIEPWGQPPYRLWVDGDLLSISAVTAGGSNITANCLLEPHRFGPPYNRIEIDRDSSASFEAGQRAVAVTGRWGYCEETAPIGTLVGDINNAVTTLVVSNSAHVGAGDLIFVDNEAMIVTDRAYAATTADSSGADALDSDNALTFDAGEGALLNVGEVIEVESERMLITSIVGDLVTVKRAWDGTILAAHGDNIAVSVPRSLTVVRGAYGTTPAAHTSTAAITKNVAPGLIREWCIAEAIVNLSQEGAAFGRTVGAGENERESSGAGLNRLAAQAKDAYTRRRLGVI